MTDGGRWARFGLSILSLAAVAYGNYRAGWFHLWYALLWFFVMALGVCCGAFPLLVENDRKLPAAVQLALLLGTFLAAQASLFGSKGARGTGVLFGLFPVFVTWDGVRWLYDRLRRRMG